MEKRTVSNDTLEVIKVCAGNRIRISRENIAQGKHESYGTVLISEDAYSIADELIEKRAEVKRLEKLFGDTKPFTLETVKEVVYEKTGVFELVERKNREIEALQAEIERLRGVLASVENFIDKATEGKASDGETVTSVKYAICDWDKPAREVLK